MGGRSNIDLPLSFALLSFAFLLTGCVSNPFLSRSDIANNIARSVDWQASEVPTDTFRLRVYMPRNIPRIRHVTIYLEGDGLAFIDRTRVSADPTPSDPQALRLAIAKPTGTAYVARPCQYTLTRDEERCNFRYWTYERYSDAVVTSMSQAVDHVKSQFGATEITLVGYSGGGVIAALLAARRSDVALLVTVAANLDTDYWADYLEVPRLSGSLNPARLGHLLSRQPQVHVVGTDDEIVPPSVAQSYAAKIDRSLLRTIKYVNNANHDCCWTELWPDIVRDVIR